MIVWKYLGEKVELKTLSGRSFWLDPTLTVNSVDHRVLCEPLFTRHLHDAKYSLPARETLVTSRWNIDEPRCSKKNFSLWYRETFMTNTVKYTSINTEICKLGTRWFHAFLMSNNLSVNNTKPVNNRNNIRQYTVRIHYFRIHYSNSKSCNIEQWE